MIRNRKTSGKKQKKKKIKKTCNQILITRVLQVETNLKPEGELKKQLRWQGGKERGAALVKVARDMNAEQILDNKISLMLKTGSVLPRAPERLVEKTARRMVAIERGHMAERELSEYGKGPGDRDLSVLAAESVIGRMAQHREMNSYLLKGSDLEMMANEKAFKKAVGNKSPSQLLDEISSGKLVQKVAKDLKPATEQKNEFNRQISRIKENKPMSL